MSYTITVNVILTLPWRLEDQEHPICRAVPQLLCYCYLLWSELSGAQRHVWIKNNLYKD